MGSVVDIKTRLGCRVTYAAALVAAIGFSARPVSAQVHVHPEASRAPREGFEITAHRAATPPDIDGVNSNPARRFYQRFQYSPQTFYSGPRTDIDGAVGIRATSQASAELSLSRNDVNLPWGDFVVNLAAFRFDYAMSPRMTLRSLSQYNSLTRQLSNSVRYNFVYRPGSDLCVVYDDLQATLTGLPQIRNRQIIVKMTYLLSR